MLITQMAHMDIRPVVQTDNLPPAGRLKNHISTRKVITSDPWVLWTIRGYRVDFLQEPLQRVLPHTPQYSVEHSQLIVEEVREFLGKGAITEVHNPQGGFYSSLFLVPKKDGGQRPVINLKALNSLVHTEHFKMEGIHTLRDLVNPEDWMAKVDLKDAYFAIPIHQSHHKYLRFRCQHKCYQFQCLPFGLSSAPWVFTKDPEASTSSPLGDGGVTDILAESQEQARHHAESLVYLLQCLGFKVNQKKSVLIPAQVMEFLGFTVDTVQIELKLPVDKIKKIRVESRSMAREDQVSGRALARLVGKMNAISQVILPAPLFYRHLQMALSATLISTLSATRQWFP